MSEALIKALEAAIEQGEPGRDAGEMRNALVAMFGSPAGALEASAGELRSTPGMTAKLAVSLSVLPELARYTQRERIKELGEMRSLASAASFLGSLYLGEHYESCHMTCLGESGAFLGCEKIQSGTINETPFYTRNAVEAALRTGACAVVLSHNHPGGAAFASQADMESTKKLLAALCAVGVTLIDHVIVAEMRPVSMREDGTPEKRFWNRYAPLPKAFAGWLGGETG